jgi:hypothetical protein
MRAATSSSRGAAVVSITLMPTLKIVHGSGADRTLNHLVLIEHRKLNDHPMEVEAPHVASL